MTKNATAVMLYQFVNLLLIFICRRIFISHIGIEFLGYNSVFSNLLSALNVAELGISSAITSFLYKPIAQNDHKKINAIIHLYKQLYRLLAIIIAVVGVLLSYALPYIIPDSMIPYSQLKFYYFIALSSTVVSYLCVCTRTLFIALERSNVIAHIDLGFSLCFSALQIALMYVLPRFEIYLAINVLKSVAPNLLITYKGKRRYRFLSEKATKQDTESYKRPIFQFIGDVFIAKLGSYVFWGTDSIIISVMRGSLMAGFLANYTLVTNSIKNVITQMLASTQAGIANYIYSNDDQQKQLNITNAYLYMIGFIGIFCMNCIAQLLGPFVELFFGAEYLLSKWTPILLGANLFLSILLIMPSHLFVIYRLYKYDKMIILVSILTNFLLSITFVRYLGVSGVLVGTTFSSLVYIVSRFVIIAKHALKVKTSNYTQSLALLSIAALITMVVSNYVIAAISWPLTLGSFLLSCGIVACASAILPLGLLCWKGETKYLLGKILSPVYRYIKGRKGRSPLS